MSLSIRTNLRARRKSLLLPSSAVAMTVSKGKLPPRPRPFTRTHARTCALVSACVCGACGRSCLSRREHLISARPNRRAVGVVVARAYNRKALATRAKPAAARKRGGRAGGEGEGWSSERGSGSAPPPLAGALRWTERNAASLRRQRCGRRAGAQRACRRGPGGTRSAGSAPRCPRSPGTRAARVEWI